MQKIILLFLMCYMYAAAFGQVAKKDSTSRDSTARVLMKVTVTGRKPLVERRIDRTVINIDQSLTAEGATVLEAMQRLPGVQVTPDGQVSVNGKSGVNVYIDGKPTYLSAADLAGLLSGMAASSVQRIEIMTNPPARYDASGTTGIINIVRKKNHKAGFNASMNGSLVQGHYGRYNGGISGSYRNQRFNFFFNDTYTYNKTLFGRKVSSDLLDVNGTLLTGQVSDNRNDTWRRTDRPAGGVDWYVSPKTTLSLAATSGIGSFKDRTVSELDISDKYRMPSGHEDFSSQSLDHPYNYTTTFQWAQQLDSQGRAFTVDLDYSDFTNKPVQINRGILYDTSHRFVSETDALLLQRRVLHIYSAQVDYVHPVKKGRLEVGLKSSFVKIRNDNTYYDQLNGAAVFDSLQSDYSVNTEQINAAYGTVESSWKKLTMQAGLRAEQATIIGKDVWRGETLTQKYFQLFPTLFLNYQVSSLWALLLRLGRRTERPDYSEMIPFRRPLTPTLYFQGNPNLRPQLTWHGELGWSWQNAFSVTAGIDLDHDYMQTIPYLDSGKTTITRRPTNVQAHSWNVDLTWSRQVTKWWSTDNTLSIYRNGFSGEAGGYPMADPGMVSVYLSASNSFRINDLLSAELGGEYDSERRLVTSKFGAYYLVNAAVKRVLWKGRGSLTLNAHNIFQSEGHNVIDRYPGLYQYSNVYFYSRSVGLSVVYRLGSGKLTRAAARSSSEEEQHRAGN
jgi:hypothetical protein